MADDALHQYPEAIPLHRVAPAWRTIAIVLAFILLFLFLPIFYVIINFQIAAAGLGAVPGLPAATMSGPLPIAVVPVDDEADGKDVVRGDLPYPIREDLRRPVDEATEAAPSPRQQFLKPTRFVWRVPREQTPGSLTISADGLSVAYFQDHNLIFGPFNALQLIDLELATQSQQRNMRGLPPTVRGKHIAELMPSGVPAWAADDQSLFFANAGGQLYRLTIGDQALHPLALRGRAPRPLVNEPNKVVLIRSKTTVKTNGAAADPTRIVLADLDTQQERTVVPAGARTWIACVPSPGGSQLAAVASEGPPAQARRMLYLVRLADGKLDPLGPAASHFSVPTWTPDGSAVVYSREQNGSEDLFLWDVAARKEIQLSRGGGFSAPTVTNDGNLFFLATSGTRPGTMTVRQAPLAVVRKLAAAEPEPRVRGPAVWLEIIEKIGAKNADARLDAAALQRLADAFRRELRERFQETVPDTAQGLEPYLRELAAVPGSPVERAAILHVYAAVGGNYLQRKHGATWQWRAGPFNENATGPDAENAFAVSVNVVQCGEPGKARYPALQAMLDRAEGRALLLVNDAASGREAAAALVDPDLERATKLLNDGKAEEGEKVLLALVEREAHQRNRYLKAHVGMLLYEYGRKDALRRLLDSATERGTVSAGLSNLQGLLVLDTDPRQALVAFKKALRCDLHFEAAYLNLAQAYEQVSDPAAARACLRRYLELFPQGPLSADALERLGKLQ